jgi:SAM-dependent methyltransferase
VTEREFAPVAASLRESVLDFYAARGKDLKGPSGQNTLHTNSIFVERRGQPLLKVMRERIGVESLDGLSLVDLGAGFGALSLYFALHGARVTAVDPNAERLVVGREVAERHDLTVRFKKGRMQRLRLPGEKFDVAVHNNSFCYIVPLEERKQALLETLRVLRPGGLLVARDPNRWHPIDQFSGLPIVHLLPPAYTVRFTRALGRPRSRVRLASPTGAVKALETAGFVNVKLAPRVGNTRTGIATLLARYQHYSGQRPESIE